MAEKAREAGGVARCPCVAGGAVRASRTSTEVHAPRECRSAGRRSSPYLPAWEEEEEASSNFLSSWVSHARQFPLRCLGILQEVDFLTFLLKSVAWFDTGHMYMRQITVFSYVKMKLGSEVDSTGNLDFQRAPCCGSTLFGVCFAQGAQT